MKDNHILPTCESSSARLSCSTIPPEHILVVDDDLTIRQLNSEMLTHSGYAVDAAADGAAGWAALNADNYDLLITDNNMPRLSGVELLKKLYAARMEMPVIMATGALPAEDFARCPWLQPAATVLKPYTLAELLRTVKQVLGAANDGPGGGERGTPSMGRQEISPVAAPAPARAQPLGPAHSARRILVVDEDHDLRQLYADALAGSGYRVDLAADGAAGWEELQRNRYHLLITEHDMPRLTGVQLVKKLQAARMAVPVVMAAARLPAFDLAQNPALQLAATLAKPFTVDELLATVRAVLGAMDLPREPIAPRPDWTRQPASTQLRL
jgi:DNA-binding response OmpR family regulator